MIYIQQLSKWLEGKFDSLCKAVNIDESISIPSAEISLAVKNKAAQILANEIPSPLISFSFLYDKLGLKAPKDLVKILYPPKIQQGTLYKGNDVDSNGEKKDMSNKTKKAIYKEQNKNKTTKATKVKVNESMIILIKKYRAKE